MDMKEGGSNMQKLCKREVIDLRAKDIYIGAVEKARKVRRRVG